MVPAQAGTRSDAAEVLLHHSKMDANADEDDDVDVDAGAHVGSNGPGPAPAPPAVAATVAAAAALADAFPGQVAAPSRCTLVKFVAAF